ncbi:MAG: DDE-type integrase/transposase/recombinase [Gallionellaceae bacterium]|nr:DDE-type integrase/transposase/recombinase [Gallionellaceae bacterium]
MKSHYSCAELAAMKLPGLPTTPRAWLDIAKNEGWEGQKRAGRGGGFEYTPPAKIAKLIAARHHLKADGHAAQAARTVMAAVKVQTRAEHHAKTQVQVEDLMASLSLKGREKLEAHFDLVLAFRSYFQQHNSDGKHMRRNEAFEAFAEDYNANGSTGSPRTIKVSDAVRAKYTTISARSIQRWVLGNEQKGLVACADRRAVKGGTGGKQSTIEQHPELEKALIAIISEKPHIKNKHLCDAVNEFAINKETGVIAWPAVSYWAICRWRDAYQDRNKQALMAVTNPDGWKNNYLSALGKQDEDVLRLNQRWEMDGTPADWMLVGGRYTASVVIDIFARRPKILFSKTPRTETNKLLLRSTIMEWGVPEEAKTDNGSDYTSRELRMFFDEMGITHTLSNPFSPWEKPHVERFIKTFLHGIMETLDSFIGHNVAERKQIEAKRTFAENLFKKNAAVEVDMTVEELQQLADQWVDGIYMQREHRSLSMSPLQKVASYTGAIKRITNERAFDILLAKPAGRLPVITKKGIRYDNATFIHAELPIHQGKQADIRLDPNDLGRLIVYVEGKFLCIAECPERTGMDRQEVAAHGRQKQKAFIAEKKREYKAAKAALPMSTDELVREILVSRAEQSGKVAVLAKRAEAHSTEALLEAERVIKSQETPALAPHHAKLMEEARQMHAAARNPNPIIIDHPAQHSATPLEGMSAEQKYDLWLELDGIVSSGGNLTEPWQQRFHAGFPKTSAYRGMQAMRQEAATN